MRTMAETTMLLFLYRLLKDVVMFCTFEKIQKLITGNKEVSGTTGLQEAASISKKP